MLDNRPTPPGATGDMDADTDGAAYRIGAVSRLAGVPVTTLRVWETRHAAFAPAKSSGRHRLYAEADVIKARLLRQLTVSGHSVGGIARLPVAQLQQLLARSAPAGTSSPAVVESRHVAAIVVGAGIAARINSPDWASRHPNSAVRVRGVFTDLDEAEAQARSAPAPVGEGLVLLVKLNTISNRSYEQLARTMALLGVGRAIVLYNYGAESLVAALRATGLIVRREPVADEDFAELIRSIVVVDPGASMAVAGRSALIPGRRYSDATLARIAVAPNNVLCECPRHIAELILQLASFEAYSQECLNDSHEDARLHAFLRSIAGSARALFEHALQMAAQHGSVPELGSDSNFAGLPAATGA